MRVLLAPDSFGGTMSAVEAAEAVAGGWLRSRPGDSLTVAPMSDGGPGFIDVIAASTQGRRIPVRVPDPLGRPVDARVFLAGDTGYVESAEACGLALLTTEERDPLVGTSYGVGVLLMAAVEAGARRLVVGLGGSATNDCGAGMLAAIGVSVLDGAGSVLPYGGGPLASAARVTGAARLRDAALVAASDVDNPLVGPHGASAVFGPQKGADRAGVGLLDAALARFAGVLERDLAGCPAGLSLLPGGGAAGGLGAALLALGAGRASGVGLVSDLVALDDAVGGADLVVTGEGSFDGQSLRGKVVAGVALAAAARGVPCVVLAGQVAVGRPQATAAGVTAAYAVAEHAGSLAASMADPAGRLADLAAHVAAHVAAGRGR